MPWPAATTTRRRWRNPPPDRKIPGLDITPAVPQGTQVINSYGDGRFRIAGELHQGSVLVWPERRLAWPATTIEEITLESLAPMLEADPAAGILLLGCGPRFANEPAGLRAGLREKGVVLEWMDTGAACRTFNVLLTEGRDVAAALLAVD